VALGSPRVLLNIASSYLRTWMPLVPPSKPRESPSQILLKHPKKSLRG
jgi:hypothetical protein